MTPSLTRTGLLVISTAVAFVVGGAFLAAWPLTGLGITQLSAVLVLYLTFFPTSVMLRRRYLEFAWWVPAGETSGGALIAGRPMKLHLLLRNHTPFRIWLSAMRVVCSSTIPFDTPRMRAALPSRREVQLTLDATPQSAGYWFFHGLALEISDRFGLFAMHVYYPNLLGIKVFPGVGVGRTSIPFRPRTGAFHERAGVRTVRQPGLGSDLREIRDHTPGDPFKRIAWKATARTRKLMVREFESEILVTHWLLLDISSTMRAPRPGRSKLDYGLSLCASFSRLALEAGDRVGLFTFDHRIYSSVKPSDGAPQLYRIIERLMELHNIVDEDLTDLTDPELYAAVAEFLSFQEGVDVQRRGRPPAPDDPVWAHLVIGPNGESYHADAMDRAIEKALAKRASTGEGLAPLQVVASNPRTAMIRRFCRLNGLEIPYRQSTFLAGKERGMAESLARAAASRHSQFIVLVTDLEETSEMAPVLDALRMARRRRHNITVVAPFAPRFLEPADEENRRVQQIFTLRAERQRRAIRRDIERLGIPVLSASPHDTLHMLLRRLTRLRVLRTGTTG